MKEILEIPGDLKVIYLLPIGVPDIKPEPRGRKSMEEIFHDGKFGEPMKL